MQSISITISNEEKPIWAEVCISHERPDGRSGIDTLRIEVETWIETFGTTGHAETYPYAQYVMGGRE
jgi:hypothetical protein